jgi:hypothetical protein
MAIGFGLVAVFYFLICNKDLLICSKKRKKKKKKAQQSLTPAKECNKYDLTAIPCFLLAKS